MEVINQQPDVSQPDITTRQTQMTEYTMDVAVEGETQIDDYTMDVGVDGDEDMMAAKGEEEVSGE